MASRRAASGDKALRRPRTLRNGSGAAAPTWYLRDGRFSYPSRFATTMTPPGCGRRAACRRCGPRQDGVRPSSHGGFRVTLRRSTSVAEGPGRNDVQATRVDMRRAPHDRRRGTARAPGERVEQRSSPLTSGPMPRRADPFRSGERPDPPLQCTHVSNTSLGRLSSSLIIGAVSTTASSRPARCRTQTSVARRAGGQQNARPTTGTRIEPLPAVGGGSNRFAERAGSPVRTRGVGSRARYRNGHLGSDSKAHDSPVRRGPCDPSPLRDDPAEPHATASESVRDSRRAGWPAQNRCWFAARVIAVRAALTIDRREAGVGPGAVGLRHPGVDHVRTRRGSGHGQPSVRVPEVIAAWDEERARQLRGSSTRDRTGLTQRPSRVSVHAGRRRRGGVEPVAGARPRQVRRRRRARPEPGAGRTAIAQRYGVIIPTASRGAIVRISVAWTATTTAGPANGKVEDRRRPAAPQ